MTSLNTQIIQDIKALSFENALSELEDIVRKLEQGNIPLESAIDFYSRGTALKEHCDSILTKAKLKVEKIIAKEGKIESVEPFAVDS